MNVRELIEILQRCDDPERLVITLEPGMGGYEEATVVFEEEVGGLGCRFSWQKVRAVTICNGNGPHLTKQGYKVLGEVPLPFQPIVHFEKK